MADWNGRVGLGWISSAPRSFAESSIAVTLPYDACALTLPSALFQECMYDHRPRLGPLILTIWTTASPLFTLCESFISSLKYDLLGHLITFHFLFNLPHSFWWSANTQMY